MFGTCPRCGKHLGGDRVYGTSIICDCGWTRSLRQDYNERTHLDRTSAWIVLAGSAIIAAFIHAVNWDTHFFSIIPLKVKFYAGIANTIDLERMGEICQERKKHECVEASWTGIAVQQPNNLKNLARLGKLQLQMESWTRAAATFTTYFKLKGADHEAAYNFAQVLTHLKKYGEAARYFQFALRGKQDTLQISVARTYIQMLMEAKRLHEAKAVILDYRRKSATAALFMEKELKDIRGKLGEPGRTAAADIM